jgi:hypothetical protein
MEAVCSTETLLSTYKSAKHYNSEEKQRQMNPVNTTIPCLFVVYLTTPYQ